MNIEFQKPNCSFPSKNKLSSNYETHYRIHRIAPSDYSPESENRETSGVVYLSLNLTIIVDLMKQSHEHIYTYETLQDQIIRRDICFVVDANKNFDGVISAVKNVPEVKEVEVFDIYAGKNL